MKFYYPCRCKFYNWLLTENNSLSHSEWRQWHATEESLRSLPAELRLVDNYARFRRLLKGHVWLRLAAAPSDCFLGAVYKYTYSLTHSLTHSHRYSVKPIHTAGNLETVANLLRVQANSASYPSGWEMSSGLNLKSRLKPFLFIQAFTEHTLIRPAASAWRYINFIIIMLPPLGRGIKRWCASDACLTSVCRVHCA